MTESYNIAGQYVYEISFFYLDGDQKKAWTSSGEIAVNWHN